RRSGVTNHTKPAGGVLLQDRERLHAIACGVDPVMLEFHGADEESAHHFFVVYYQHGGSVRRNRQGDGHGPESTPRRRVGKGSRWRGGCCLPASRGAYSRATTPS